MLTRGSRRFALSAAALSTVLALGACGGEQSSPLDDAREDDDSAQEQRAEDEQALEQLARDLWDARVESQRTSDPARERFEDILATDLLEEEVGMLVQYRDWEVTREGQPEVTAIEPVVTGDTGTVRLCLDEDDWVGYESGREIGEGRDLGARPVGLTAERDDGRWIITDFMESDDAAEGKSC